MLKKNFPRTIRPNVCAPAGSKLRGSLIGTFPLHLRCSYIRDAIDFEHLEIDQCNNIYRSGLPVLLATPDCLVLARSNIFIHSMSRRLGSRPLATSLPNWARARAFKALWKRSVSANIFDKEMKTNTKPIRTIKVPEYQIPNQLFIKRNTPTFYRLLWHQIHIFWTNHYAMVSTKYNYNSWSIEVSHHCILLVRYQTNVILREKWKLVYHNYPNIDFLLAKLVAVCRVANLTLSRSSFHGTWYNDIPFIDKGQIEDEPKVKVRSYWSDHFF